MVPVDHFSAILALVEVAVPAEAADLAPEAVEVQAAPRLKQLLELAQLLAEALRSL